MAQLTLDDLRDLYVHSVTDGMPEDHLRAKAHRKAREAFNELLADTTRHAHTAGWVGAINAVNVQYAAGMRESIDNARQQVWDEAMMAAQKAVAFPDEHGVIRFPANPYREETS